ncbi:MAG: serine hydrolase [bacterium]|nr:serine hydrolase [bacterium]
MKRGKSLTAILLLLICMFTLCIPVQAKRADQIERAVSEFQNKTKCSSVAIGVYDNGEVTYYGNADSDALFQIGSMTKAFTGLGAMKLVSEGKLSLDALVSDYLPEFEMYYEGEKAPILVKHLFSQESGITNSEKDYPSASEGMTLSDWVQSISGKELTMQPGIQYAYSNANYNLLGALIEEISGVSYKEYMEQELLLPLGLTSTTVGVPESGKITEGSRLGYLRTFDYEMPVKEGAIPAGYFYSNMKDMCRWIQIWTGECEIPSEYDALIAETKSALQQTGDYFSGWEAFADGVIGHSGGTANFSSRIVFSSEKHTGVCVLTNLNVAASTDRLCNDIFAITTGNDPSGFVYDVWTIFDFVFVAITIVGILLLLVTVCFLRKTRTLVLTGVLELVVLVSILVVIPMIFQSGWGLILFTWAPWSVLGGLVALVLSVLACAVRIVCCKRS